eukprot:scpid105247/ scgid27895/ Hemicentin-1; Fibulin-6
MHNGSPIIRRNLSGIDSSWTLINLAPPDKGVYTVSVKNAAGHDSRTFSLDIQVPPIVDTFSTLNSTKFINEDIFFEVRLKYTPNPLPTITWLHNGSPVNTSLSTPRLSSVRWGLSLRNLAMADSGVYTVVINSTLGSEKVKFSLDVQALVNTFSAFNITRVLGENITFDVFLRHIPWLDTIVWMHDGSPIKTRSDRTQFLFGNLSLRLINLTLSDSGGYT